MMILIISFGVMTFLGCFCVFLKRSTFSPFTLSREQVFFCGNQVFMH